MPKYIKKPIPIEAEKWDPSKPVEGVSYEPVYAADNGDKMPDFGVIETLEGPMTVWPGDYVVTGVRGEKYAVKREIFEETYELVPSQTCGGCKSILVQGSNGLECPNPNCDYWEDEL